MQDACLGGKFTLIQVTTTPTHTLLHFHFCPSFGTPPDLVSRHSISTSHSSCTSQLRLSFFPPSEFAGCILCSSRHSNPRHMNYPQQLSGSRKVEKLSHEPLPDFLHICHHQLPLLRACKPDHHPCLRVPRSESVLTWYVVFRTTPDQTSNLAVSSTS